jgi:TetR/AcrR family transcriptional regulator
MASNSATTPARRPRVRSADRRASILATAREVFQENGLAGARTKIIAELAGTSEAILYRHFASKEDLFAAAVLEPVESLVARLVESADSMAALGGHSRRQASYEVNAEVLANMREVAPLLGVALFSDREAGRRFYRERLEPLLKRLTDDLQRSLEEWPHWPISAELVVAMQLGTYNWIALQEHFGSRKPDGDTVSRMVTDVLVRAL